MTLYLSLGRRANSAATCFSPLRPLVFLQRTPRTMRATNTSTDMKLDQFNNDLYFLYHQPYPPIRLDKGFRMGHDDRVDLLVGDGLAIAAHIEPALVDCAGDLVRLHAVAGRGKEVDDGFCEVPQTLIIDSQII